MQKKKKQLRNAVKLFSAFQPFGSAGTEKRLESTSTMFYPQVDRWKPSQVSIMTCKSIQQLIRKVLFDILVLPVGKCDEAR